MWEKGKNQETLKTRRYSVKKLSYLENQHHQLPENLLQNELRVINLRAIPLFLNGAEWKSMFGLIWDPQLTVEQSQIAICDTDTQKIVLEETACLLE